ncbi:MAG: DUF6702 family protein [Litorimonas sp.]
MTTRRVVLGSLAAVCVARPALAHRSKRTETEVRIEPDGTVGVTHVYHAQDAQDVLYATGILSRPDISTLRARAKLALYTADQFALMSGDVPVELSIVGAEIIGQNVYVYQSGTVSDASAPLAVSATMFREHVGDQTNSVNIVRNGETSTLDFRGDDGWKAVA